MGESLTTYKVSMVTAKMFQLKLRRLYQLKLKSWANIAYSQDQRYSIGRPGRVRIAKNSMNVKIVFNMIETMIKSGFFIKEIEKVRLT